MSQTNTKAAGFLPSQLGKGGLKTDFNAEIIDLHWDYYTYEGKDGAPGKQAFGALLTLKDEEGEESEHFYSAGDPSQWTPSEDKSQAIPVTSGKLLNDNSNFAFFIKEIVGLGIPENKLSSIKDFIGGDFFWTRKPQPERAGLEPAPDGKKRTTLVATRINRLPWDAKKSAGRKTATSAAAASSGAPAPASNGTVADIPEEIVNACGEIVPQLLADKPDGLALKALMPALMKSKLLQQAEYKPNATAITKAILKAEVLASLPGITFENGVISFAG